MLKTEVFEKFHSLDTAKDNIYLKCEDIEKEIGFNNIICAMIKMEKCLKDNKRLTISAQHDEISFNSIEDFNFTESDIEYLYRCGVQVDDAWHLFIFV